MGVDLRLHSLNLKLTKTDITRVDIWNDTFYF